MDNPEPTLDLSQTVLDQDDYQRLLKFILKTTPWFALGIAKYKDARVRDGLVQMLELEAAQHGCPISTLHLRDTQPDAFLPDIFVEIQQRTQTLTLFVLGLERFLSDFSGAVAPSIQGLNSARDTLPVRLPVRLVLWLQEEAIQQLSNLAHDFFDVTVAFFAFGAEQMPTPISALGKAPAWMRLAKEEDHEKILKEKQWLEAIVRQTTSKAAHADHALRIGKLSQILGDFSKARDWYEKAKALFGELENPQGTNQAQFELAQLLQNLGQPDEALNLYHEILEVWEKLGDIREAAVTRGKIADILQARGQLDEALEIREKHQLPVYEKLGDIREATVTRGKIADILQARGLLDEALEIREKHQLPVYEKLGDIRSAAVTRGQIADILEARGQLDEALEIREKHELPVFEKLGDIRETAITRGKIADILWKKGHQNKSIENRRDVLPVYVRLGDKRSLLVGQCNLAQMLMARGHEDDLSEAIQLLQKAFQAAHEMQIPEAQQIAAMLPKELLEGFPVEPPKE